jgi:phage tail-like protein
MDMQKSFYFTLLIPSLIPSLVDMAFQEATGMSKEMAMEDVVSGGQNQFKYRLPNGVSYPNLVLKRGVVFAYSPLIEWCEKTLDPGFSTPIITRNIDLFLLSPIGVPTMLWHFEKAYPVKYSVSDLKSQDSALLIETIEFAYRYSVVTDPRISPAANALLLL